jgi:biopolymer transport protein ExbD
MNLRKRHKGASAEVHTSAMNDIMFFLLLFFLIASTVTNPNVVKLLLPKSSSGQSVSKKPSTYLSIKTWFIPSIKNRYLLTSCSQRCKAIKAWLPSLP